MLRVEHRLQRRKRGMQPEESIEIDRGVFAAVRPRDGDGRAQIVIRLLAVRHDNVQPVRGAALEDRHQYLFPRRWRVRGIQRPLQPQRRRAHADHRQRRITKKNTPIRHTYFLLPLTRADWDRFRLARRRRLRPSRILSPVLCYLF